MDWVFWVLFFFSLSRLWVHLAICSKIKSWVVGLIFRDLEHREVDVGGEIVSYNFRCFKSLSQNLQPPTPFPEVFWGPSPSPHLALHPSMHPSMLLGSRLHTPPWIQVTLLVWVALCYPALCIVVCICRLIVFILLSNAVVNSWQTRLAFYLLLDTKRSPVDSVGISNIPAEWKLSRLAHVTESGTEKGGLEWEHQGWDFLNANVMHASWQLQWGVSLKATILKSNTHFNMLHFGLFVKTSLLMVGYKCIYL